MSRRVVILDDDEEDAVDLTSENLWNNGGKGLNEDSRGSIVKETAIPRTFGRTSGEGETQDVAKERPPSPEVFLSEAGQNPPLPLPPLPPAKTSPARLKEILGVVDDSDDDDSDDGGEQGLIAPITFHDEDLEGFVVDDEEEENAAGDEAQGEDEEEEWGMSRRKRRNPAPTKRKAKRISDNDNLEEETVSKGPAKSKPKQRRGKTANKRRGDNYKSRDLAGFVTDSSGEGSESDEESWDEDENSRGNDGDQLGMGRKAEKGKGKGRSRGKGKSTQKKASSFTLQFADEEEEDQDEDKPPLRNVRNRAEQRKKGSKREVLDESGDVEGDENESKGKGRRKEMEEARKQTQKKSKGKSAKTTRYKSRQDGTCAYLCIMVTQWSLIEPIQHL